MSSPLYFAVVQALHRGIFQARRAGYGQEEILNDVILAAQKCLRDYEALRVRTEQKLGSQAMRRS
jgi:hypothetical protein